MTDTKALAQIEQEVRRVAVSDSEFGEYIEVDARDREPIAAALNVARVALAWFDTVPTDGSDSGDAERRARLDLWRACRAAAPDDT
jgi:hypothetical protein